MRRNRTTTARPAASTSTQTRKKMGVAATLLPLAISMIPSARSFVQPAAAVAPRPVARRSAAKEFRVPMSSLQAWAAKVVVSLDNVTIDGNSKVHRQDADCEMHFGAHSPNYQGEPAGLVLEPMNACSLPFPGKSDQSDADWIDFANDIKNTTVTVSGVPRIWPEHLTGGGGPSNPDHAVEFHPLTTVVSEGQTFDFSAHVSAGEYEGGVSFATAQKIVSSTTVTVTRNGSDVDLSFFSGRIGNFTVLDLTVERLSIRADSDGSFRMNGHVVLEDGTSVPVRMVSVKGSPVNEVIGKVKSSSNAQTVDLGEMLILFSLSPELLLSAANQSQGQPINLENPIQLILYGLPES